MFGKSMHIKAGDNSNPALVWAIYEGEERSGTKGKEPIAWFKNHGDALAFIKQPEEAEDAPTDGDLERIRLRGERNIYKAALEHISKMPFIERASNKGE